MINYLTFFLVIGIMVVILVCLILSHKVHRLTYQIKRYINFVNFIEYHSPGDIVIQAVINKLRKNTF